MISGYLITSLICSERQRNEFFLYSPFMRAESSALSRPSSPRFLATIVLGYFVASSRRLRAFGAIRPVCLGRGIGFLFFARTPVISIPRADTMPLLHTWSLGVEEQFYVIWPGLLIILVGLSRMMKIPVLLFISAIIAASFAAFFLITRTICVLHAILARLGAWAWSGDCLPLPEVAKPRYPRLKKLLPWAGFTLIGAAVCRFGSTVGLTGNVAAAVLGACFIIFAIEPKTWIHRILSSMPFVFIGKDFLFSVSVAFFPPLCVLEVLFGRTNDSPSLFHPVYRRHYSHRLAVVALHRGALSPRDVQLAASISRICRRGVGGRLCMLDDRRDEWRAGENPGISTAAAVAGRNVAVAVSELAFGWKTEPLHRWGTMGHRRRTRGHLGR